MFFPEGQVRVFLQGERGGYVEQIVASLAQQLQAEYGRGFGAKNLHHVLRLGEVFEGGERPAAEAAWPNRCGPSPRRAVPVLALVGLMGRCLAPWANPA